MAVHFKIDQFATNGSTSLTSPEKAMFLTRLLLNLRSSEARADLANVHAMHRRVLSAFPDANIGNGARSKYGALYRVDSSRGEVCVLLQSALEPQWSKLPPNYLATSFEPNPATTDLSRLLESAEVGRRYRFRLRANPTKRAKAEGNTKRGPRVELVGVESLFKWLCRKAMSSGFELSAKTAVAAPEAIEAYRVQISEEPKVRGRRGGATLSFGSALFEGELRVTDQNAFATAVKRGFGTGKSYGFGLLSLASM